MGKRSQGFHPLADRFLHQRRKAESSDPIVLIVPEQ
jgi:hypothetical protein